MSFATETDLANAALDLIGEDPIAELFPADENARLTKLHRALQRHYRVAVSFVLEQRNWSRARAVKSLVALNESDDEFERLFQLPADCVRVQRLTASGGKANYRWARRDGPDAGRIASDALNGALLVYTALVTPSAMGASLGFACASKLALELAVVQSENTSTLDRLRALFRDKYREAAAVDASEGSSSEALIGSRYASLIRDGGDEVYRPIDGPT